MDKIRYYRSFDQDFSETADQNYQLPEDYRWIRKDIPFRILSALTYGIALIVSSVYCRLFLHVRFRGAKKLRKEKGGVFLYGNHTQPVGDVFDPALACFPKRIYTLASPANYAIPIVGKLLPYLGALPIGPTIRGMKELTAAIETRLNQNCCIVIYPEAHVWEYCTMIRPFSETAFKFPVKHKKPVYAMTATYQKRRFGKKPAITIYIDGPFFPEDGTPKEQARSLFQQVYDAMQQRSAVNNCEYIRYLPETAQTPQH